MSTGCSSPLFPLNEEETSEFFTELEALSEYLSEANPTRPFFIIDENIYEYAEIVNCLSRQLDGFRNYMAKLLSTIKYS